MTLIIKPCGRCKGSGKDPQRTIIGKPVPCSWCRGCGAAAQPKFSATCADCGAHQTRPTTAHTAEHWMAEHIRHHHPDWKGA